MSAKRVLVVNTGSSSLKFKLYDLIPSLHSTISGLMERIGDPSFSTVTIKVWLFRQMNPPVGGQRFLLIMILELERSTWLRQTLRTAGPSRRDCQNSDANRVIFRRPRLCPDSPKG